MPFQVSKTNDLSGIRLTTARYYTPSGQSIQGKGITPDIVIEQGEFESYDYKTFSESDLKDSLDKKDEFSKIEEEIEKELTAFEKRLAVDYQLQRAIDLIRGVSLYKETLQ